MSYTRLLLVDDDAELCALLKTALEKTGGFAVEYVNDPALAHSRAKDIGPDNLDVFVLDIDMPTMSGGELAELLHEDPAFAQTPILFLSSLVSPQEAVHHGGTGRFPVLSKGNTLRELVQALQEAVAA